MWRNSYSCEALLPCVTLKSLSAWYGIKAAPPGGTLPTTVEPSVTKSSSPATADKFLRNTYPFFVLVTLAAVIIVVIAVCPFVILWTPLATSKLSITRFVAPLWEPLAIFTKSDDNVPNS